mmetsp:Transcript_28014/g.80459  ORF Transcript_28014/g.80459 Transcript_28014/m.80459 type:complete len:225 (+) Transcript_28014:487-1161(+)
MSTTSADAPSTSSVGAPASTPASGEAFMHVVGVAVPSLGVATLRIGGASKSWLSVGILKLTTGPILDVDPCLPIELAPVTFACTFVPEGILPAFATSFLERDLACLLLLEASVLVCLKMLNRLKPGVSLPVNPRVRVRVFLSKAYRWKGNAVPSADNLLAVFASTPSSTSMWQQQRTHKQVKAQNIAMLPNTTYVLKKALERSCCSRTSHNLPSQNRPSGLFIS